MRIAVTGGTGMIGAAVCDDLRRKGHEVAVISRSGGEGRIQWDPEQRRFDPAPLEGFDAVIHLAGEPIAQRWTGEVRERIYSSRVRSTKVLVDGLRKLSRPPRTLLSASGINYYPAGRVGDAWDESGPPGEGFLPRVCLHWEIEARRAEEIGMRVCLLRTAVVLAPEGGALAKLLPVFRMGAGGPVAPGDQPFPWLSLSDYAAAVRHLLAAPTRGAVNLVSPGRVTNAEFSRALAEVLGRPCVFKVPKIAVRAVFGEMGRATLLEGVDAVPAALEAGGFAFGDADLKEALARMLDRGSVGGK